MSTLEFIDWQPIDEQMDFDERGRLLYVACTLARDHLVVSLHRKQRANLPKPTSRTSAELLVEAMGDLLADLDAAGTLAPVYRGIDAVRPDPRPLRSGRPSARRRWLAVPVPLRWRR